MSEQRTMRERCERIIVQALAQQYEFAGHGDAAAEPDAGKVVDAILAELREPDAAMRDAGLYHVRFGAHEAADLDAEDFTEAWRAAIDAIREGEG